MRMKPLGRSGIEISDLCLGTMTWGTQTPEQDAHAQMDMALANGINIVDTAEMYPTNPLSKETQGDTERVIGRWNAKNRARRGDYLLATKVSGSGYMNVRDGVPISRRTITEALENSLRSLQTDYIDLYQLHWPNRGSYMFRQNWAYDPTNQNRSETLAHMQEVLETLQEFVTAGKIRYFGLSNESSWGMAQWLRLSEEKDLPRAVSVQNEYSLLCRLYDLDMAEMSHNEDVGLLAFSPLAAGLLSGKYQGDQTPQGSRRSFVANLGGRLTQPALTAVDSYLAIARKHGLHPVHMALAWVRARPFVATAIFGATSLSQLETVLEAADLMLEQVVLDDIAAVHKQHPMPF